MGMFVIQQSDIGINLRGLVLAGVLIGTLGALDGLPHSNQPAPSRVSAPLLGSRESWWGTRSIPLGAAVRKPS